MSLRSPYTVSACLQKYEENDNAHNKSKYKACPASMLDLVKTDFNISKIISFSLLT